MLQSTVTKNNYRNGISTSRPLGAVAKTKSTSSKSTSRQVRLIEEPREWVELVEITPKVAQEWLDKYPFDGQRPVKENQVSRLVVEMRAGRFKRSEFRIGHVGESLFLSNGQHRLHAVVRSGVTIPATIYHFTGKERGDIADDYTYCDINSLRTMSERLNATDILSRTGLSSTNFNALASAVAPIIGGFTSTSFGTSTPVLRSAAIRLRAIEDYAPAANRYFELVMGCENFMTRSLRRKPILSVGLITLVAQPETAAEFWQAVAENDGLRRGDPRHTFSRWLISNDSNDGSNARQSRIAANAWNSFMKGKSNLQLKVYDELRPIRIEGTREYDGQQIYFPYGEGE